MVFICPTGGARATVASSWHPRETPEEPEPTKPGNIEHK